MKPDVFINTVTPILYLSAFIYGLVVLVNNRRPLYFKLLFFGVGCFLLENMYYLSDYICFGGWSSDFSFAVFGAGGCYAFMLSANLELSDKIGDDGLKTFSSARRIGYIAPAILLLLFGYGAYCWINIQGSIAAIVLVFISKLPAFPASYFYLKYLAYKDESNIVITPLRLCSVFALCVILLDFISDLLYSLGIMYEASLIGVFLPLSLLGMIITANKGVQKWTI